MIIAIDFDNTITSGNYPDMGKPREHLAWALQELVNDGHRLILWTCRIRKDDVEEMMRYCTEHSILHFFEGVNQNVITNTIWDTVHPMKIFADLYIDDRDLWGHMFGIRWYDIVEQIRSIVKER